jgi:hypothetical protein
LEERVSREKARKAANARKVKTSRAEGAQPLSVRDFSSFRAFSRETLLPPPDQAKAHT